VAQGRSILIGSTACCRRRAVPRPGLLIVDEEQRFGVKHKESIKAIKKTSTS